MFGGFAMASLLFLPRDSILTSVLVLCGASAVVFMLDDRAKLPPLVKLAGQVALAIASPGEPVEPSTRATEVRGAAYCTVVVTLPLLFAVFGSDVGELACPLSTSVPRLSGSSTMTACRNAP
jgi:UDP-N-acetylmuramyl pentapeptide phosphotransferase/UDP-N-acetylglucosamine-1-phosphate transferase